MKKIILIFLIAGICFAQSNTGIFLPGTQAQENNIIITKIKMCMSCHSGTKNGNSDPYFSWKAGMMANAMKDPVFRATMTIANQDIPGAGEYCIRCHSPSGWLEGRSKAADGSLLTEHDMSSVSCDVCHRLVDPQSKETKKIVKHIPPGYGNSMMVVDPQKVARGPYADGPEVRTHDAIQSEFHNSGNLCGTCHDVSNPLFASDISKQKPYEYGMLERTFSEWESSSYAQDKNKKTCQDCHFPLIPEGGKASRFEESPQRDYFRQHGPTGSSTWVQLAMLELYPDEIINKDALLRGVEKSKNFLKTAASLEVSFSIDKNNVNIRIINQAGHKLPTGYFEGRRMWLNIKYFDDNNTIINETGKYEKIKDKLAGKEVIVPDIIDKDKILIYECQAGISKTQSQKFNIDPGKSFHFVLNDYIVKDNRIPPKGFSNDKFKKRMTAPIGHEYEDGQYWDTQTHQLPEKCSSIEVILCIQSTSWEYIKFLYENNITDDWGKKLYNVWQKTGQCPPEVIAKISAEVK